MYKCINDTQKDLGVLLLCKPYVMHTVYQFLLSFLDLVE